MMKKAFKRYVIFTISVLVINALACLFIVFLVPKWSSPGHELTAFGYMYAFSLLFFGLPGTVSWAAFVTFLESRGRTGKAIELLSLIAAIGIAVSWPILVAVVPSDSSSMSNATVYLPFVVYVAPVAFSGLLMYWLLSSKA